MNDVREHSVPLLVHDNGNISDSWRSWKNTQAYNTRPYKFCHIKYIFKHKTQDLDTFILFMNAGNSVLWCILLPHCWNPCWYHWYYYLSEDLPLTAILSLSNTTRLKPILTLASVTKRLILLIYWFPWKSRICSTFSCENQQNVSASTDSAVFLLWSRHLVLTKRYNTIHVKTLNKHIHTRVLLLLSFWGQPTDLYTSVCQYMAPPPKPDLDLSHQRINFLPF